MPSKTALVTGAASGIGRSFATTVADRGYRVVLVDIDEAKLAEAKSAIPHEHVSVRRVDISSEAEVERLFTELAEELDGLDLLVNSAAILGEGSCIAQPIEDVARVIQVDLMGTVLMIRNALPLLRRAKGHIVNMASTASLHGWPLLSAYSAAKGGVENYSEAIRPELRREGIGLTTVFPLLVDTPLLQRDELPPILKGRRVTAEHVVREALRAVERRQARVFVPRFAQVVAVLHGVAPTVLDWWGARAGLRS